MRSVSSGLSWKGRSSSPDPDTEHYCKQYNTKRLPENPAAFLLARFKGSCYKNSMEPKARVSLWEIFKMFFFIGATGFGSTLEIMHPRVARLGLRFTF